MQPTPNYSAFQADDFLNDPSFRAWIANPSLDTNAHWQDLLRLYPHLRIPFSQALLLGQGMEVSWTELSDTYTQELLERIKHRLEQPEEPTLLRRIGWRRPLNKLAAVAAIVLVAGGWWAYAYYFSGNTYHTRYGETLSLTLYDGSDVTLNANSQLSLPTRFAWRTERTVSLSGEAYFKVKKQPSDSGGRTFTVKTDQVEVEVLGTQFSVYARPARTTILLDEGSIRLVDRASRRPFLMAPGQVVELTPNKPIAQPAAVDAEKARQLTSWRSNVLIFDDADMPELTQRFAEVYGLELVLRGDVFIGQEFRGELPVNDVNQALKILSETFDCQVTQEGKRVYFVKQ